MKWAFDEYGTLIVEIITASIVLALIFSVIGMDAGGTENSLAGVARGIAKGLGLH